MVRYGICFSTNTRKAPHIKLYTSQEQRDKDFIGVTITKKNRVWSSSDGSVASREMFN